MYNSIFEVFYEITGFDLSKHTIESDQGKGLVASCSKYGCTHLKCLKHFITSLKNKKFSYEVGQLVKFNCQKDYDKLIEKFNEKSESIGDQKELNELEKRLNKIGHSYKTKQISIADELLWEQISMLRRIEHKMPSTTNNIESKHGNLNDITPRNNTFLGSINRLILSINTQTHQFNRNINQNYKKVVNNTIKLSKNTYIKNKCEYYNSDIDPCECWENRLYSEMFRLDIPCSRRFSLGATFSDLPNIDFDLENQFDELIVDILLELNVDECRETNFFKRSSC